MFENPFWIGLYERIDDNQYEVCKITFGTEPKDYEVYEFMLRNWSKLKFSSPIKTDKIEEHKINPKRMQREINRQLENKGIGTKAQREDTILKNYPLYCPKCKQETLTEANSLQISVIIEPDAKPQSR